MSRTPGQQQVTPETGVVTWNERRRKTQTAAYPFKIKVLLLTCLQGAHMDERDDRLERGLPLLPPHHRLHAEDGTGLPLQLCHQHCSQHH